MKRSVKNPSSEIRPKKQLTTPVDKRASNTELFWYRACVRMIRMPMMQELVLRKTVRNNRNLPSIIAMETMLMIDENRRYILQLKTCQDPGWDMECAPHNYNDQLAGPHQCTFYSLMWMVPELAELSGLLRYTRLSSWLRSTVDIQDNCGKWDVAILHIFGYGVRRGMEWKRVASRVKIVWYQDSSWPSRSSIPIKMINYYDAGIRLLLLK